MRSAFVALAVAAAAVAQIGIRVDASTGPIPLKCDRACLEKVMDQYLAAVVAHDPSRAPLSADVKYTENNQVLAVGDGFWKTAGGHGNYKHYFADPELGQVAFMGTMMEAGAPLLVSLRLRIELGRITEVESVYFRPGGGGPNNIAGMDKSGKPEDIWFRSIPPAQRLSRQEMIAIADGYLTGLQKNDGKGIHGTAEVGRRLREAAKEAKAAATREHDAARNGHGGRSVALVLADKAKRVEEELKAKVGRLSTSRLSGAGSYSGYEQGRTAGRGASLTRGSVPDGATSSLPR